MRPRRVLSCLLVAAAASVVVAGPAGAATVPQHFANCTQLNARYHHGVGLPGARDHTTGRPVTTFSVNKALYTANKGLDRDRDGIACEKR